MISIPDDAKKVLAELYDQKLKRPITALELPCTKFHKFHEKVMVQIDHPGDQKVACPKCGRQHLLIWSKVGNHKYG